MKGDGDRLVISYRDASTYLPSVPFSSKFLNGDGDALLAPGELAAFSVDLSAVDLGADERFSLELSFRPAEWSRSLGRCPLSCSRWCPCDSKQQETRNK